MPFEMCDFLFQTKYTGIPASIRAFDRAIAQFTWPRVAQGAVWRELTEVVYTVAHTRSNCLEPGYRHVWL